MKKYFLLSLVLVLLISGCATRNGGFSGAPSWVHSTYDNVLNQEDYFCAVGQGKERQEAINNAMALLAQAFNVKVQSVQTVSSTSTALRDSEGKMTFADESTLAENNILSSNVDSVIGVEVHDTYRQKDGLIWVRVALDRKKTLELYRDRTDTLKKGIQSMLLEARMSSNDLAALAVISKAEDLAEELDGYYVQMQVLSDNTYTSLIPEVNRARRDAAAGLTFVIDVRCEDSAVASQIEALVSGALMDYGVNVNTQQGNSTAEVNALFEPVNMANSPYAFCTYAISVQLVAEGAEVFSWNEAKRVAGLSESAAYDKAVKGALESALTALDEADF